MSSNSDSPSIDGLHAVLQMDAADLKKNLRDIVECSPWVIDEAALTPPFASEQALWEAVIEPIGRAPYAQQIALLRAHPELAGEQAKAGTMTVDSTSEQARLGLLSLPAGEFKRLNDLNRRYRERFGLPFIVALRLHSHFGDILALGEQRLRHDPVTEVQVALAQVYEVIRGRLHKRLLELCPAHAEPSTPPNSPLRSPQP